MSTLSFRSNASHLPLYRKVIFVDWHGVLSCDVFWRSILDAPTKRYKKLANEIYGSIFNSNNDLVSPWMKGEITSEELLKTINPRLSDRQKQVLLSALRRDCQTMEVHRGWRKLLRSVQGSCWIVIATDNIDCFWGEVDNISGLSELVDVVLCSSELGVLKGDSAETFFGDWLHRHDLEFSDSCLIDDSDSNCRTFDEAGGMAIHFKDFDVSSSLLVKWLEST